MTTEASATTRSDLVLSECRRNLQTLQPDVGYYCGMSLDPNQDTSPEALHVQLEILRHLTPTQKLALVDDACRLTGMSLLAGLRQRHPRASDAELHRRLMGLMLSEDLATGVFGPIVAAEDSA